jgi:hypothetical protein
VLVHNIDVEPESRVYIAHADIGIVLVRSHPTQPEDSRLVKLQIVTEKRGVDLLHRRQRRCLRGVTGENEQQAQPNESDWSHAVASFILDSSPR